jgi:hypothetical protein
MPTEPTQTRQPTANTADDAFLDARARIEQWQQEFQGAWFAPRIETAAKMLWSKQPEPVKNYIRQSKPEAAAKMDELLKDGEV